MYLAGFGNHHSTEAIQGALPTTQNSPQHCPMGLYAEQISGSAFTRPRAANLHTWLYRTLPTVSQGAYFPYNKPIMQPFTSSQAPNPYRWSPPAPLQSVDFIDGLFHLAGSQFLNAYWYQCDASMTTRYLSNLDGEFLIVPAKGALLLQTELGNLTIKPGQIAVIPRGIKFKVTVESYALGYLCENRGNPFTLPQLGLLGANALANPRHFLYPQAAFEDSEGDVELICKSQQQWWQAKSDHSPLNVVAWHGNYAPYCYDLSLFNTINSVSFDHPDPSIFTVLTSESDTPGVANCDFVIFPARWVVTEHTFRPPYFHRNIMNEFMGLIQGEYDAKAEGFKIGGVSIHNCMTAHGPDTHSYQQAITQELKPIRYRNTLAFMFESRDPWLITEQAFNHPSRQHDYVSCWQGMKKSSI